MVNEEIELNFDVNVFECHEAFKYKYTKSNLSRLKLIIMIAAPIIVTLTILAIKFLYNYFRNINIFNINFKNTFMVLIILCIIFMISTYILHKRRVNLLATIENEKYMDGRVSYRSKVVLGEEYMTVNSDVFYGRVYYKGIQDIIVFKDIIVILVKPSKTVIIPISAFENLESRKNFISILNEKIQKNRII